MRQGIRNIPPKAPLSQLWRLGLWQVLPRKDVRAWLQGLEGARVPNLLKCALKEVEGDRRERRLRV